jgi:tripartite-type tricarboxylate transporter receptor subunit TctC
MRLKPRLAGMFVLAVFSLFVSTRAQILRGGDFGRPMIAGRGTPADRVNILREAYVKSMNNPELVAEAKKARMDIEFITGEQLQALAKRVMNQPPAVLNRVKKILE